MPENKKKTYVSIVLDRSGSMSAEDIRKATVSGYNEQVEQIQQDAKDQDIFVSLITFNGHVYEHFWNESADKLQKSSHEDYVPAGSTALYDSIGYAIDKLQKTTTEDENTAYLLIIITDGDENSSTQYQGETIKNKITSLQKDKNWTFTFMGCGDELFKLAEKTNVSINNCAIWENADGDQVEYAMHQCKEKLGGYFDERRRGVTKLATFHASDTVSPACYTDKAAISSYASSRSASSRSTSTSLGFGGAGPAPEPELVSGIFATAGKEADLGQFFTA